MDRKPSGDNSLSPSPPAAKPDISFFCPAYLDENSLRRVVGRGVETLEQIAGKFEWTIIEDCSPDGTAAVADRLAADFRQVAVIHNAKNMGHGNAVKKGFAISTLDWVGFCDGDDQYDPRDMQGMLGAMDSADVIIGSRIAYPNSYARKLMSAALNTAIRHFFSVPYKDLGCSFKLFRKEAVSVSVARSSGIFAQCEMVLRAHRAGFNIIEVPVRAYPRTSGASSSITLKSIRQLVREMLSLWYEFNFK